ncbi:MAG: glycosyl transferase [Candidatus Eisenbacteria bacterium]|nr:glycosyl transferase [Candidatus Eisenbacteria bacterium]
MPSSSRRTDLPDRPAPAPAAGIVSNGAYTTLLTNLGTGFSTASDHALYRWRPDRIEDPDGFAVYLRDLDRGDFWSAAPYPVFAGGVSLDACWEPGRLCITRRGEELETQLDVCVHPEEPLELRRLTLHNRSRRRMHLEATSFLEIVLNAAAAHEAHPAFSKLFLSTAFNVDQNALLIRRRSRGGEHHPWAVHAILEDGPVEWESDRRRFFGRAGRPARPEVLRRGAPLSGTVGDVLDPVLSLRRALVLGSGESRRLTFLLGTAPNGREALEMRKRMTAAEEVFDAAAEAARRELRELELSEEEAEGFQALAGAVLYRDPRLRAPEERLRQARGARDQLARHGLDPQRRIVLLKPGESSGTQHLQIMLKAQRYWNRLALPIQLAILHETPPHPETAHVVPLAAESMPPWEWRLLEAAAAAVVTDSVPALPGFSRIDPVLQRWLRPHSLDSPLGYPDTQEPVSEELSGERPFAEQTSGEPDLAASMTPAPPETGFPKPPESPPPSNGFGEFSAGGAEYVIRIGRTAEGFHQLPPCPWINVVANERFGFLVSERGAGCAWRGNSREHRLTPWLNDPLRDPHGEAFYLRDEDTGVFWSPWPGPTPGRSDYEVRHGFGYTSCRHASQDLEQEVVVFVPRHDPVKIAVLRLNNRGPCERRLSFFAYHRLVLGSIAEETAPFITTETDADTGALFAVNGAADDFAQGVAFSAVNAVNHVRSLHVTGDRESFIGRGRGEHTPAALSRGEILDGCTGAGLDPCLAQQLVLLLPPGGSTEIHVLLGEEDGPYRARDLIRKYAEPGAVHRAYEEMHFEWRHMLSGVEIDTPSQPLNIMVNGWLPYQVLSCRLRARSALYQSGGAFGFRDQLQDAGSLLALDPGLTRAQIILHAAHQFIEGDVLHWWHPPRDRGIRTRFADDLLWLPWMTAEYVATTGDRSMLDEEIPFIEAPLLQPGEDEVLLSPAAAKESASLYEHCCRALDRSLTRGSHGLPLFGSGDWNDAMNRVGREGRGESVWLGFFLYSILGDFAPLCTERGDGARAGRYRDYRRGLGEALNASAWDGEWYLRGFFDNGAPLGSHRNEECRIDALAQSWAVLSGAAPAERAQRAMDAVERHLISFEDGMIRLLRPSFDKGENDPGYIAGYAPGVRENGGQYTHAALWVVQAMAALGRRDRVAALLELLNPVQHARTREEVERYQVEPYVVAADVYGEPPHVGRGGWTWYTGSAGWMYRVALESLLGFRVRGGGTIVVKPCIPDDWPGFSLAYRLAGETTRYLIEVGNPESCAEAVVAASLDGEAVAPEEGECRIPLRRDGRDHHVTVTLGAAP